MTRILFAGAAIALVLATPAVAQSMPGMSMSHPSPKPAAKKSAAKRPASKKATKKTAAKKAVAKKTTMNHAKPEAPAGAPPATAPAPAMDPAMPGMTDAMPGMDHPAPKTHNPSGMATPMPGMAHDVMGAMTMNGALGSYAANRESSGTAWQPDNSADPGIMTQAGQWMLMLHGNLNLVYDSQGGPRGDEKAFASGMLMGMAQHPLGKGALQFKAMVSPDPLTGKAGYPLLLASGETADGVTRLIDRQHPHDLFMELSASISQNIGTDSSLFLYGGLPGEPAFGPPAFMHREAIADSPEAPISHHWLDSTHISFGVVTAGVVVGNAKLEVSRFNGREPDQHRYNIETGPLDSTSVRLSWNPTRSLALQGSWGYFRGPEQLEPGVNQKRLSASALYSREIAPGTKFSATLAWGRKTIEDHSDDAFALEAGLKHGPWTVFSRAEMTENGELVPSVANGLSYRVGKASLGAIRDFRIAPHVALGLGGLVSINVVPDSLVAAYGGHHPTGAMGFVRLKLM